MQLVGARVQGNGVSKRCASRLPPTLSTASCTLLALSLHPHLTHQLSLHAILNCLTFAHQTAPVKLEACWHIYTMIFQVFGINQSTEALKTIRASAVC